MGQHRTTAAAFAIAATLALTACGSDDGGGDDKPDVPPYKITHQSKTGNQRTVDIEVKSTKQLEAVFEDAADKLTDDAGYYIGINCNSGGSAAADNRLANGRKAVGSIGAAVTGMNDGDIEYEAVEGRTCPDK
ncbi:hypothetical protein [Streptomyces sp. Z26]|uniref:hypothetical protein n=1 Tax=Streptomyces sp. Z26 TaxID=2500177 RepID=UPI0019D0E348|nr:hypothetical protein [Streptomyces sp. Z26]